MLTETMPIPPFDANGLLPPFIGEDATGKDRSPYMVTIFELAQLFGDTPRRRRLLANLIMYRALLASDGYQSGLQFIGGAFVENIELTGLRDPDDIDVLSIVNAPKKYIVEPSLWTSTGKAFWDHEIADRRKNKQRYSLDAPALIYENTEPYIFIRELIYWYGLFSHQRSTRVWKEFLALTLDFSLDQATFALLSAL